MGQHVECRINGRQDGAALRAARRQAGRQTATAAVLRRRFRPAPFQRGAANLRLLGEAGSYEPSFIRVATARFICSKRSVAKYSAGMNEAATAGVNGKEHV